MVLSRHMPKSALGLWLTQLLCFFLFIFRSHFLTLICGLLRSACTELPEVGSLTLQLREAQGRHQLWIDHSSLHEPWKPWMEDEWDLRIWTVAATMRLYNMISLRIVIYPDWKLWDVTLSATHLYPWPINAVVKKCEETLYCGVVLLCIIVLIA